MFLGVGNAVSEGSVPYIGLFIAMGFCGNSFWINEVYYGLRVVDICQLAVLVQVIIICLLCIKEIFDHQHKYIKDGGITGEPLEMKELFKQIFGYFLPTAALTYLAIILEYPYFG